MESVEVAAPGEVVLANDPRIKFEPPDAWQVNGTPTAQADQPMATAELHFRGTGIEVSVVGNEDRARTRVFIDGKDCGVFEANAEKKWHVYFQKDDLLPDKLHCIRLVHVGPGSRVKSKFTAFAKLTVLGLDEQPCDRAWMELSSPSSSFELKVMSWNIFSDWCGDQDLFKCFTPHPDSPGCCENRMQKWTDTFGAATARRALSWDHRLGLIVKEVFKHDRHVVAFQEMSQAQFTGINIELAKLGYIGIHVSNPPLFKQCKDGCACHIPNEKSERGCCHTDARQVKNGTETALFWRAPLIPLSIMAEQVDTAEFRSAIAVAFKCPGNRHVVVTTAHPSWKNEGAGMEQLCERIVALTEKARNAAGLAREQAPLVICGDFNKEPNDTFFKRMTGKSGRPLRGFPKRCVDGTFKFEAEIFGDVYTDNKSRAFRDTLRTFGQRILDFIFYSKAGLKPVRLLQVDERAVLGGRPLMPNTIFASDHVSILCDFKWI